MEKQLIDFIKSLTEGTMTVTIGQSSWTYTYEYSNEYRGMRATIEETRAGIDWTAVYDATPTECLEAFRDRTKMFSPWFGGFATGWHNPRSGYSIQPQGNGLYDIANTSGQLILGESVPANGLKSTANRDARLSVCGK